MKLEKLVLPTSRPKTPLCAWPITAVAEVSAIACVRCRVSEQVMLLKPHYRPVAAVSVPEREGLRFAVKALLD